MSVRNYWFYNPEGGMMGLDWCQVYAILKLKNVRRAAREVERLELMQNAVIDEMAGWS